jgi:hypothetical protein
LSSKVMKNAEMLFVLIPGLISGSLSPASAEVVGTLNVHIAADRHSVTGRDSGQRISVQVDFSSTQDGIYEVTVWSGGDRQLGEATRVYVQMGKATQGGERSRTGPVTVYCPATPNQDGPISFQVFVQAVFENGQKGGKVLIAEADWQTGSVEDHQPGKQVEPRQVVCSAGSNIDSHATGSFVLKNQSDSSREATLFFGGRKYGDYKFSSHGDQRIQVDAWGVNPGVGWYVTTPNPLSPNGRQIEAAGPIYNTEGGNEAGFNAIELGGANPETHPSVTPARKP